MRYRTVHKDFRYITVSTVSTIGGVFDNNSGGILNQSSDSAGLSEWCRMCGNVVEISGTVQFVPDVLRSRKILVAGLDEV